MSVFPKAKFSIVDFSTRYSSEETCRELFFYKLILCYKNTS